MLYDPMAKNISLQNLIERINSIELNLETEYVGIDEARCRILAEDIVAPFDSPLFDNSAMDGFAVDSTKLPQDDSQRVDIPVVGASLAGHPMSTPLFEGAAARIMTGAKLPEGADSVLPFELAEESAGRILFDRSSLKIGGNIRRKGEEFRMGQVILPKSTLLNAFHIGIAASLGYAEVKVFKIRTAVFSTGDELAEPGEVLKEGQIYNSNSRLIGAICASMGCTVTQLGRIPDEKEVVVKTLAAAFSSYDLVLTSGGLGEGDKDFLSEACDNIDHYHVKMRPGKPFALATSGESVFLGLPGNPVASAVSSLLFVRALISKLSGSSLGFKKVSVQSAKNLKSRPGRSDVFYGSLKTSDSGALLFEPSASRGSAQLTQLHGVDAVLIAEEDEELIPAGSVRTAFIIPSV